MAAHLDELRSSQSATAEPILLPGDRAALRIAESQTLGVPVSGPLREQLNQLATRLGVAAKLELG